MKFTNFLTVIGFFFLIVFISCEIESDNLLQLPPDQCSNGILDEGEDEIDCGGICNVVCRPDTSMTNNTGGMTGGTMDPPTNSELIQNTEWAIQSITTESIPGSGSFDQDIYPAVIALFGSCLSDDSYNFLMGGAYNYSDNATVCQGMIVPENGTWSLSGDDFMIDTDSYDVQSLSATEFSFFGPALIEISTGTGGTVSTPAIMVLVPAN